MRLGLKRNLTIILAAALALALLMPWTRDIVVMAGRPVFRSYVGTPPWSCDQGDKISRIVARHKDDVMLLQGAGECGGEVGVEYYERALALRPSDPGLHAGIIRTAMGAQPWLYANPGQQPRWPADPWEKKLVEVVLEHARWGMENDPDNAFFYYSGASASAVQGNKAATIEHFLAASHKRRFDPYIGQATRALARINQAQGMARLEARHAALVYVSTRFVDIFSRLSDWIAREARTAEAGGRSADALRLDLANFRTGRLLFTNSGDAFQKWVGFEIMRLAGPQVSYEELRAAQRARHDELRFRLRLRLKLQLPRFEKYMLSHGVPRDQVSEMRAALLAAEQELLGSRRRGVSGGVFALYRFPSGVFYLSLALYWAVGFSILSLALKPLVRMFTRGNAGAACWGAGTAAVLWILLLTLLAAIILSLARIGHPALEDVLQGWLVERVPAPGPSGVARAAIIAVVGLLLVTVGLFARAVICILRRSRAGLPIRTDAIRAALVAIPLVPLTSLLGWLPFDGFWKFSMLAALLIVGLALILVFSMLRGWIVSRRVCTMGFGGHFLTSLLASSRTVAVGSAVVFTVGLYVALPFYLQAINFADQYIGR